jgi:acyl carrier protein
MTESTESLEETVLHIVRDDILDTDGEFTTSTPLLESGLDSFSLTQLLLAIEEETGIWIDESHLTREHLENVETLTNCLREVSDEHTDETN